jgi:hypothetical protein
MNYILIFIAYFAITSLLGWLANRPGKKFPGGYIIMKTPNKRALKLRSDKIKFRNDWLYDEMNKIPSLVQERTAKFERPKMSIAEWIAKYGSSIDPETPYLKNQIETLGNNDIKKLVIKKGVSPGFATSLMIRKKCYNCNTVHYVPYDDCKICGHDLIEETEQELKERLLELLKYITEKHNHAAIAMGVQCGKTQQQAEFLEKHLGKPFKPKDQK